MLDHLMTLMPIAHAGATWFMVGLIWFVQIVHYPLMGAVPESGFSEYALAHQRRPTWVVGPVMFVEAGSALLLVITAHEQSVAMVTRWIGLGLLAIVWASTFAVQVPLHAKLALGFDPVVWRRLVTTNWLRTIAWTARGIVALLLLG